MKKLSFTGLLVVLLLAACNTMPESTQPDTSNAADAAPSGILDPQKGPAHTGYILDNDEETPVKIQYQVVDGYAIYDGDVGIGAPSEVAKTPAEALQKRDSLASQALHRNGKSLWSGGVIPVHKGFAPKNLQAALNQIQRQVPGIKFVPYTGQSKYLKFYQGGANYYAGCSGGECRVYLKSSNANKALVMHELGHALGFQHEMKRCDRGSYIRMINTSAAPAQFKRNCNFKQLGNYDYNSIMHYNSSEFGTLHFTKLNGQKVKGYWGRTNLSPTDVAQWRKLYPGKASPGKSNGTIPAGYTVNLRSGPGENYKVVGTRTGGQRVTIVCHKRGTSHKGPPELGGQTSNLWDKLANGAWVSDAWVNTGTWGRVAPWCK